MIKPTQGRVVLYHPRPSDRVQKMIAADHAQPHDKVTHAAIIAHVIDDDRVNLTVFDSHGNPYGSIGCLLLQPGYLETDIPEYGGWCEWLSYQVGQAAKNDGYVAELRAMVVELFDRVSAIAKVTTTGGDEWPPVTLRAAIATMGNSDDVLNALEKAGVSKIDIGSTTTRVGADATPGADRISANEPKANPS